MKKFILVLIAGATFGLNAATGGVQPLDTSVPAWENVDPIIQTYITSGFTILKGGNSSKSIVDTDLTKARQQMIGTGPDKNSGNVSSTSFKNPFHQIAQEVAQGVKKIDFALMKLDPDTLDLFANGTFNVDFDKLAQGVQKGTFKNLNYHRLVIAEYLLGRVVIGASALQGSNMVSNTYTGLAPDTQLVDDFVKQGQTKLIQTRYLRNAFLPHQQNREVSSGHKNPLHSGGNFGFHTPGGGSSSEISFKHYLTPADTFVGLILDNHLGAETKLHIGSEENQISAGSSQFYPSLEHANNWTAEIVQGKWGKQRTISFAIEGNGTGKIALFQDQDALPEISSSTPQTENEPVAFDSTELANFFKDPQPWAVIIKTTAKQGLQVIGLAKLNTYFYPDALTFSQQSADNKSAYFSLGDVWKAPFELYGMTLSELKVDAGQPYPFGKMLLQGLYNGHLQTSFYKQLVPEGGGTRNGIPRTIYWKEAWNTASAKDWLAYDSPLDWKFLRALIVTQAASDLMYVGKEALPYLDTILADPSKSYAGINYIGATKDYTPVIAVKKSVKPVSVPKVQAPE